MTQKKQKMIFDIFDIIIVIFIILGTILYISRKRSSTIKKKILNIFNKSTVDISKKPKNTRDIIQKIHDLVRPNLIIFYIIIINILLSKKIWLFFMDLKQEQRKILLFV